MIPATEAIREIQFITAELIRDFTLPPETVSKLYKYYLLHWESSYFQELYYKRGAMFTHQGDRYLILWHNHDIRPIMRSVKVALSFRKLHKDDYNGYVIVKALD